LGKNSLTAQIYFKIQQDSIFREAAAVFRYQRLLLLKKAM
jgi:hypothetical protein